MILSEAQATAALLTVLAVAILGVLLSAWRALRLAAFRQDLFDVRDDLFDIGIENRAIFGHPSYILLRNRINGMIRFAHIFTIVRLLSMAIVIRPKDAHVPEGWELHLGDLPRATQEKLNAIHRKMLFRTICYVLYLPVKTAARLWERMKSHAQVAAAKQGIRDRVEMMEDQAAEEFGIAAGVGV